jgi:Ion channel
MPRPRLSTPALFEAAGNRPRWLTKGVVNLAVLCALIVLMGMLSPRLSRTDAGITFFVGLGAFVLAASFFVGATRRLAQRFMPLSDAYGAADAVLITLRRIGLPLLGLGFFLAWTFVYVGLWWAHPQAAFTGLGATPRFADFFYYAVTTAFVSPPGDIVAHSRGARSATMIEMLTGFGLLAAYLSSFVDWSPGTPKSEDASEAEAGS